jgi:putative transposase
VRVKKRKRARLVQSTNPQDRLSAARPNHVWALDFQFDQTSDCRVLKCLNITDEYSKEALAIEVERLINIHGAPASYGWITAPK